MANIQEEVEDKIIDWIALGTNGRLIAFKPESGADLIIQKKGDYSGKKLFLNISVFITPRSENNFVMDVSQNNLEGQKNAYLLFVVFDKIKRKVEEKIWFVSVWEFLKIADKFKFDSSKFLSYSTNKSKFISFLIEKLILENKATQKKRS